MKWIMVECDHCRGTGKAYGHPRLVCPKCYGACEYEVLDESPEEETDEQSHA